jgi:RHS repeat-associated protein
MRRAQRPACPTEHTALKIHTQVNDSTRKIWVMPTAAKKGTFSASSDPCVVFPLAASAAYPKTRIWGSEPENVHCSRATTPLRIELRRGCEESSEKTAVGSGDSFKYDPLGHRIYKSSSAGTSVFAYDGDDLIEETNSAGAVVARYALTGNIDEPLAMLRSGGTSYFEQDDLGSVTSLSNGSGALAQTYTFDSFGNQTAFTGSLTNPLRFAGREFDTESSLYYMRARYFDPAAGRFISEDPKDDGSLYDDLNRYVYTENNPTNWTDPLGLYTLKKGGKHPPLPPSPEIDALLKCIEGKTGLQLTVTSTSEDIPEHAPGTPHRRGVAVDVRYSPGNADKILCAAGGCGAGFALDEAKNPSPKSTGDHIHLQIPPSPTGRHGDLPPKTKCPSCSQ